MNLARLLHVFADHGFHLGHDGFAWQCQRSKNLRWSVGLHAKFFDQLQDWLNALLVTKSNRGKHVGFADFSGANFDHVHAVLVARKHQVQIAEIKLSDGWIDDELRAGFGLQTTHAHSCDWTLKWSVGD